MLEFLGISNLKSQGFSTDYAQRLNPQMEGLEKNVRPSFSRSYIDALTGGNSRKDGDDYEANSCRNLVEISIKSGTDAFSWKAMLKKLELVHEWIRACGGLKGKFASKWDKRNITVEVKVGEAASLRSSPIKISVSDKGSPEEDTLGMKGDHVPDRVSESRISEPVIGQSSRNSISNQQNSDPTETRTRERDVEPARLLVFGLGKNIESDFQNREADMLVENESLPHGCEIHNSLNPHIQPAGISSFQQALSGANLTQQESHFSSGHVPFEPDPNQQSYTASGISSPSRRETIWAGETYIENNDSSALGGQCDLGSSNPSAAIGFINSVSKGEREKECGEGDVVEIHSKSEVLVRTQEVEMEGEKSTLKEVVGYATTQPLNGGMEEGNEMEKASSGLGQKRDLFFKLLSTGLTFEKGVEKTVEIGDGREEGTRDGCGVIGVEEKGDKEVDITMLDGLEMDDEVESLGENLEEDKEEMARREEEEKTRKRLLSMGIRLGFSSGITGAPLDKVIKEMNLGGEANMR